MLTITLQAVGLVLLTGTPSDLPTRYDGALPKTCRAAHTSCPPASLTAHARHQASDNPQVVYLNFDGGELTLGDDDAPNNTTIWEFMTGTFVPFPAWTPDKREMARTRVAEVLAPFDVVVTLTRPESGPYTMVMIAAHGEDSGGFSTTDCGNANANTIAFVAEGDATLADANLIVHEAGHSFGLGHTQTDTDEIMNSVVWDESELGTECVTRTSESCLEVHELYCAPGGQNSHAELCGSLGPQQEGEDCSLDATPVPDPNPTPDPGSDDGPDDGSDDGSDDMTGGVDDPGSGGTGGSGAPPNPGGDNADLDAGTESESGDDGGAGDDDGGGCRCTSGPRAAPSAASLALLLCGWAFGQRRRSISA